MIDNLSFHDVGVLLMAHGTPARPQDIEAFYTRIRRGHPPSPEQLSELVRRYEAIGGTSPLAEITVGQARALRIAFGLRMPVEIGTKFASPTISEAVAALADSGVRHVIGLILAPQYSSMTSEAYFDQARTAVDEISGGDPRVMRLSCVGEWHLDPMLVSFLATDLRRKIAEVDQPSCHVVFSAHSLPVSAVHMGDPYPGQVEATSRAVAAAAELDDAAWTQVWQSAGRTAEEWLGPDIREVLVEMATKGLRAVVACPVGFSADNLETLYDLDIEAAAVARDAGIRFARTAVPGADRMLFMSLAQKIVRVALESPVPPETWGPIVRPSEIPVRRKRP